MSCGFLNSIDQIKRKIDYALAENVLILAAAGNAGAMEGWRWPARENNVLGMTAAYGEGNKYGKNPTPSRNRESFSILGCAVPGYLRAVESQTAAKVSRSGTSHATAVATAIAAITMQILRDCKEQLIEDFGTSSYDQTERVLRTKNGMEKVFRHMVGGDEQRDGYYFVRPWTIVLESNDRRKTALHVARNLVQWCAD